MCLVKSFSEMSCFLNVVFSDTLLYLEPQGSCAFVPKPETQNKQTLMVAFIKVCVKTNKTKMEDNFLSCLCFLQLTSKSWFNILTASFYSPGLLYRPFTSAQLPNWIISCFVAWSSAWTLHCAIQDALWFCFTTLAQESQHSDFMRKAAQRSKQCCNCRGGQLTPL